MQLKEHLRNLLTDRHKQKTHERFGGKGEFIDTYKIRQSVEDRATLDIIYIGKTTSDKITNRDEFDAAFEDVFKERTKEEREKKFKNVMERCKPI
jgi:type I restriction enzyme R subunit